MSHALCTFNLFNWMKEGLFSSVQFSRSVTSDSLRPHELQHTRPPCPSRIPGVHLDSCPSSRWCHPAISFSVVPFFSCPQSLPASESFPMSQIFAWGGQSTGASALASVLPKNIQDWSPLKWTGWISLQCLIFANLRKNGIYYKFNWQSFLVVFFSPIYGGEKISPYGPFVHAFVYSEP